MSCGLGVSYAIPEQIGNEQPTHARLDLAAVLHPLQDIQSIVLERKRFLFEFAPSPFASEQVRDGGKIGFELR